MPSLNLTPDLIARFICLPGTALIKCSPAELMTDSGMFYKPEAAADWERKNMAVRRGVIISMNRTGKGEHWRPSPSGRGSTRRNPNPKLRFGPHWDDVDSISLEIYQTVYYLGRQDEADDEYVVVKIGQIVGVRNGA